MSKVFGKAVFWLVISCVKLTRFCTQTQATTFFGLIFSWLFRQHTTTHGGLCHENTHTKQQLSYLVESVFSTLSTKPITKTNL